MLLLERLSRRPAATATGCSRVVRGSAVNQDGASQRPDRAERPVAAAGDPPGAGRRRACRPADVDAVEAHGTGTPLGDPIEAQALLATYGQDRRADRPLLARLGQVQHRPHPGRRGRGRRHQDGHGDAARRAAAHPARGRAVAARRLVRRRGRAAHRGAGRGRTAGRPRRAGVSSFGISGTNAHVVILQAPAEDTAASEGASAGDPAPGADSMAAANQGAGIGSAAVRARRLPSRRHPPWPPYRHCPLSCPCPCRPGRRRLGPRPVASPASSTRGQNVPHGHRARAGHHPGAARPPCGPAGHRPGTARRRAARARERYAHRRHRHRQRRGGQTGLPLHRTGQPVGRHGPRTRSATPGLPQRLHRRVRRRRTAPGRPPGAPAARGAVRRVRHGRGCTARPHPVHADWSLRPGDRAVPALRLLGRTARPGRRTFGR